MLTEQVPTEYGFVTTSVYDNLRKLRIFKFTYVTRGQRQLYKIGKRIYNKYGVLPREQ